MENDRGIKITTVGMVGVKGEGLPGYLKKEWGKVDAEGSRGIGWAVK